MRERLLLCISNKTHMYIQWQIHTHVALFPNTLQANIDKHRVRGSGNVDLGTRVVES